MPAVVNHLVSGVTLAVACLEMSILIGWLAFKTTRGEGVENATWQQTADRDEDCDSV